MPDEPSVAIHAKASDHAAELGEHAADGDVVRRSRLLGAIETTR